jgi:phosphoenolpyruvate mutase
MPAQVTRLREEFSAPGLIRLVGSHDALGARLAERAGFDGVWASSFEISASHGVPDAGILSMSDFLAAAASMAAAVHIPVIADCDSGFGNAINVIHMVRRYEAAGVAAVCLEDKAFPKVNSLAPKRQELAAIAECVGKIEAAKDAQLSSDFMVIARVEALIAGQGQEEALQRAHAYADAGADAILIHDKSPTPNAIVEFCGAWDGSAPLVVVPTTYYSIAASELSALGVKMVIYANQGLRARVQVLEETFAEILKQGTTSTVEPRLAPISSIFELQGYGQLERDERNYVRLNERHVRAVIVAIDAVSEANLHELIAVLNSIGIRDVKVTGRQAKEALPNERVMFATDCKDFASVLSTPGGQGCDTLVMSAETTVQKESLERLLSCKTDMAALVDFGQVRTRIASSRCPAMKIVTTAAGDRILEIGSGVTSGSANGEFAEVALFSPRGFRMAKDAFSTRRTDLANDGSVSLADVLQLLVDRGEWVVPVERFSGMRAQCADAVLSARSTMY